MPAEIPAGRIGHSSEVYVYTGSAYSESLAEFIDEVRARVGAEVNWPQFYPPGNGEVGLYDWKGYSNKPENWLKIGRIRDISGPEPSVNEVDVTSNDSPDNTKEFIPGLKDGGQVSFDMIYDVRDASQTGSQSNSLEQMFNDSETRRFAIRVPTYRVGDTINDIADAPLVLTDPAIASGGGTGYPDADTSVRVFKNQAFHLFAGFVQRLGNEIPMEEAIMRNVELKVTGRVKSPKLAAVVSISSPLAVNARYSSAKSSGTFAAGDFSSAVQNSNLVQLPTFSANSLVGIAVLASDPDPVGIYLSGSGVNQIGDFSKQSGVVAIGSSSFEVWASSAVVPELLSGAYIELRF